MILASKLAETDQLFTEIFKMFTKINGKWGVNLSFEGDVFSYSLVPTCAGVRRVAHLPLGDCDFCGEEGEWRSIADISVKMCRIKRLESRSRSNQT